MPLGGNWLGRGGARGPGKKSNFCARVRQRGSALPLPRAPRPPGGLRPTRARPAVAVSAGRLAQRLDGQVASSELSGHLPPPPGNVGSFSSPPPRYQQLENNVSRFPLEGGSRVCLS